MFQIECTNTNVMKCLYLLTILLQPGVCYLFPLNLRILCFRLIYLVNYRVMVDQTIAWRDITRHRLPPRFIRLMDSFYQLLITLNGFTDWDRDVMY